MRDKITFLLNGARREVSGLAPTTTLLNYLREEEGLCGTKEGCAEGDCGACTVTVGEFGAAGVTYRSLNACIQFLPMLEGKSVTTVEGVQGPAGELHPCQQALVDTHGSQCGFCTPGFVMSLYSARLNGEALDRQGANDLLAGNLCRCTGYGPIVEAALTSAAVPDWEAARAKTDREGLAALQHDDTLALEREGQRFFAPTTLLSLAALCEQYPEAVVLAGATDVGLWVTKQHRRLETLISVGRVTALKELREEEDRLIIGAGVTYSEAFETLARHYPDFGELLRRLGARQVRDAGTLGGNVANGSPIGDTPPALIALGATLVLRKGDTQRKLPLEDFFLDYGKQDRTPGEFVEALEVPLLPDPARLRCYKISKRFDQDISALCGCFNISVEAGRVTEARIVFGGLAATPKRAAQVEQALTGQAWDLAAVEAALPAFEQDFSPITDMRASADYRLLTAKNLLRKYFHESQLPLTQTRLVGRAAALA